MERQAHMIALALQAVPPSPPPVETIPQPLWELALIWIGAVSAMCALLVIMWKVARPHVQAYIETVVKPLQNTANATHHQLTKNGHTSITPTVLDRIDRLSGNVDDLSRLSHRNTRKIDSLGGAFEDHKTEGQEFLAEAVKQFADQGIKLHNPGDSNRG